ncbi:hypothetical protein BSZ35_14565 [Salinibacter sp. 10B]|nr:hypothetical protein BSZ35_14565 [Salinibacter sp. 10B]
MLLLTIVGIWASLGKLLGIGWVAFAAMGGGTWMGIQSERRSAGATKGQSRRLIWAYGLSSGAMITSTTLFLVPTAMSHQASLGGLGIAIGIVLGFAIHAMHVSTEQPAGSVLPVVWELSLHSFGAGLVIGAVYAAMPALGPTLGVAIVSHKAPAGYAAARRLVRQGHSAWVLMVPASAVCIAALIVGIVDPPAADGLHALVFGCATGLFLHVAIDFLPRCGWEGEIHTVPASESADRRDASGERVRGARWKAIGSTLLGGGLVVAAWALL